MLLKIVFMAIAGVSTLGIVLQNMISVKLKFFILNVSVPLMLLIAGYLMLGFFIGLFWRNTPHFHRGKNQVPLIRADMRVCR